MCIHDRSMHQLRIQLQSKIEGLIFNINMVVLLFFLNYPCFAFTQYESTLFGKFVRKVLLF